MIAANPSEVIISVLAATFNLGISRLRINNNNNNKQPDRLAAWQTDAHTLTLIENQEAGSSRQEERNSKLNSKLKLALRDDNETRLYGSIKLSFGAGQMQRSEICTREWNLSSAGEIAREREPERERESERAAKRRREKLTF